MVPAFHHVEPDILPSQAGERGFNTLPHLRLAHLFILGHVNGKKIALLQIRPPVIPGHHSSSVVRSHIPRNVTRQLGDVVDPVSINPESFVEYFLKQLAVFLLQISLVRQVPQ
ncbi:hypothetical protein D3C73_1397210 [compost metagenome]